MYPHRKNSLVPDFRRMAALPTGLGLGFLTDPVPSTSCWAWFCTLAVDLRKIQSQGDTSQNTSLKKSWWVQTLVFWMKPSRKHLFKDPKILWPWKAGLDEVNHEPEWMKHNTILEMVSVHGLLPWSLEGREGNGACAQWGSASLIGRQRGQWCVHSGDQSPSVESREVAHSVLCRISVRVSAVWKK